MFSFEKIQWKKLNQWSPILLYTAGGLSLLVVLPNFVEFRLPFPTVLGPAGSIIGIAGITGLYPKLSARAPRLSKIGTVFLGLAVVVRMVGFLANHFVKLSQSRSLVPLLSAIQYVTLAALLVGFLLLGIAALSSGYYPNILGYLLFIPAILIVVESTIIMRQAHGNIVRWLLVAASTIQALDYLALGYIIDNQDNITYPRTEAFWSRIKEAI